MCDDASTDSIRQKSIGPAGQRQAADPITAATKTSSARTESDGLMNGRRTKTEQEK